MTDNFPMQVAASLGCGQPQPITHGGSGKKIWRLTGPEGSFILMQNLEPQQGLGGLNENDSFFHGLELLQKTAVPGPGLIQHHPDEAAFLLEDLGDLTLTQALKEGHYPPGTRKRADLLAEIARQLATWQVRGATLLDRGKYHAPDYTEAFMRQEESGYFYREFVKTYFARLAGEDLEGELDELARRAAQFPASYLIHRDFQSSNLMLVQGHPAWIDFQGLRQGPLAYDVASFLEDAYVCWDADDKAHFLECYLEELAKNGLAPPALEIFRDSLPWIAAHRMMQAIGAFSKLAEKDGKTWFLPFRPTMLRRLHCTLQKDDFEDFPLLRQLLADSCGENLV